MSLNDYKIGTKFGRRFRPILKGFINEGNLFVWCPYCATYHVHGGVGLISNSGKRAFIGHRVAHCTDDSSPFIETGYYVTVCTEQELKRLGLK